MGIGKAYIYTSQEHLRSVLKGSWCVCVGGGGGGVGRAGRWQEGEGQWLGGREDGFQKYLGCKIRIGQF